MERGLHREDGQSTRSRIKRSTFARSPLPLSRSPRTEARLPAPHSFEIFRVMYEDVGTSPSVHTRQRIELNVSRMKWVVAESEPDGPGLGMLTRKPAMEVNEAPSERTEVPFVRTKHDASRRRLDPRRRPG